MKILIPTADYPPIEGGISTVTLNLSRELAAMGHEVTVLAPRFPGMAEFDRGEPVTVIRFRGYDLGWLRFIPMLVAALPRARQADLVLGINISYGGVIGFIARALHATPYVTFGYAYEFLKFRRNPLFAALIRRVYRGSALVVSISSYTRKRLEEFGVPADLIETILPGAPTIEAAGAEDVERVRRGHQLNGHRLILSVGRMIPRKGQVSLVKAMPKVLAAHPDTMLLCVGRGPCRAEAASLCASLDLADHVRLPGYLPDRHVAVLYDTCDIFALPTGEDEHGQVEGFGLVFAEAHAHGKPVVAGRSGGVEDAVIDGETGVLVAPDDPEALADALVGLLDDDERAAALGRNGKARVERELNWGRFTRRLLECVQERA